MKLREDEIFFFIQNVVSCLFPVEKIHESEIEEMEVAAVPRTSSAQLKNVTSLKALIAA